MNKYIDTIISQNTT